MKGTPARYRPLGLRPQVVLGLLLGALVTVALAAGGPELVQSIDPSSLPALVLVLLLAILVHETGHLLAARAVGFRLRLLHLGLLALARTPAGWRLRLSGDRLLGAQVLTVPASPEGLRSRHSLMIAGGPAAHLLLAAALGAAAGAAPRLWPAAVLTAATGLINLVPWTFARGMWSDGRWLAAWAAAPARATQRVAVATLQLAAADGVRPRRWDERWVPLAACHPAPAADRVALGGALLAYAWALDTGRTEAAAGYVRQAAAGAQGLPSRARQLAQIELAFFLARFAGDPAAAAAALRPALPHLPPTLEPERWRAEAAIHLAAGRRREALDACRDALAALAAGPPVPAALLALRREQLEAIRDEASAQG